MSLKGFDMLDLLLKALCISLFGYSIGFILLELKTKLDRSFLYFGITMILLCSFCAIDLWMQPLAFDLGWTNVQHILFCFIPILFIKHLFQLAKQSNEHFLKSVYVIAGGISILFALNKMFNLKGSNAVPNTLYFATFLPYLMYTGLYINILVGKFFLKSTGYDKKIFSLHIWGIAFFTLCGFIDIVILIINSNFIYPVRSFTLFGVIGLGLLLSYLFTERIILLIKDKDKSLAEVTMAYSELEEARSLSEIGQSSAMINHEIKNYVHKALGYMQLVQNTKEMPEEAERWIAKSISSMKELSEFSNGVLDFSKSKILRNNKQLNLCQRITNTINEHFPDRIDDIELSFSDEEVIVHGDWQKLDHVFMNLFKNAFEAEAKKIKVTVLHKKQISLVTIEDDGCGIAPDKVNDMFTSFFSTKGSSGGSGLGLSIVRSIIEGHGGVIKAKSKNSPDGGETGILITVSFPTFKESNQESTSNSDNIFLIKDGLYPMPAIQKTFQNILVNPNFIQDLPELITKGFEKNRAIILGSPETIGKINKLSNKHTCYSIINNNKKGLYVLGNKSGLYSGKFNEEFILNHLQNN